MDKEYEIITFKDAASWRAWLAENHENQNGVWARLYKKASGIATVTYAEAVDQALCFGWIDGQRKSYDEVSFVQKFTPRRSQSLWSKRNIDYIARLTEAGLMMPAGVAEVERAKQDGRWDAAYDKATDMVIPQYFLDELRKHPIAETFFQTLNKSNTFAIGWRLQTAKTPETMQRRMDKIIASLDDQKKLV